jgi:hypothetical protein
MLARRNPWRARIAVIAGLCCLTVLTTAAAQVTTADAATRCRNIKHMKKHFPPYGTLRFQTRFCYNRAKKRVVYGGVNRTWLEKSPAAHLVDFGISNESKGTYKIYGGAGRVIYNLAEIKVCNIYTFCIHRVTTFKVRAYWDGGYQWRVGKTIGEIAGPP